MKICYITNTAIPSTVASAIQIVKMCEAFAKLNHKVLLITTNVIKSKYNFFNYYNVKNKFILERLKYFRSFPLGFNYYLFSFFSILKSLKYQPDLYITRNYFTCFLLTLCNKKIIMEVHHDLMMESRIVRFIVKYFGFLNNKNIIKIIAITHSVKKIYVEKYKIDETKIKVLPSGSSLKCRFRVLKNKKKLKVGYLGSLYKSRGLELIKNLAKIDQNNEYYLYGKMVNFRDIHRYSSIKNLHIFGHVPYKDVTKILPEMDILILPYVSRITVAGDVGDITDYTSPLKLFDYLTAGKIIICSNFKILKEVVKEKKNVIFIKNYKNIFAWKQEIDRIKMQEDKKIIMSKNNYNLSKEYTLDKRAVKIIKELSF